MGKGNIRLAALVAAVIFMLGAGTAFGADWEEPPYGWWKVLSVDDSSRHIVAIGSKKLDMTTIITKIEGSVITYKVHKRIGKEYLPTESFSFDAARESHKLGPAPDTKIKKGKSTVLEIDGKPYPCTYYTLTVKKADGGSADINVCHSKQLPPLFNGGNITSETVYRGIPSTVSLLKYRGGMMDNLPDR